MIAEIKKQKKQFQEIKCEKNVNGKSKSPLQCPHNFFFEMMRMQHNEVFAHNLIVIFFIIIFINVTENIQRSNANYNQ